MTALYTEERRMLQPTVPPMTLLLTDALQTEMQIGRVLQGQIAQTNVPELRQQMERHLQETLAQQDRLAQRLQELGTAPQSQPAMPSPFMALLQAAEQATAVPIAPQDEDFALMRNSWTAFATENYEVAMYRTLEALANELGDEMTATLARQNRKEEEMMARFLEGHVIDVVNLVEAPSLASAAHGLTHEAAMAGAAQVPGAVHDTQVTNAPGVASDVTHIGPATGNEWNLNAGQIRAQWEQSRDPSTAYQWSEAEPYQRFGYESAASGRYVGKRWEDIEPDLRSAYEAQFARGDVTPTYETPTVVGGNEDHPDVYKGDVYKGDVYGDEAVAAPSGPAGAMRTPAPQSTPVPSPGVQYTGHSTAATPSNTLTPAPQGGWEAFRSEARRGFESYRPATDRATMPDVPQDSQSRTIGR